MGRILLVIAALFIINYSAPVIKDTLKNSSINTTIQQIQAHLNNIKNNPDVQEVTSNLMAEAQQLGVYLNNLHSDQEKTKASEKENIKLTPPAKQPFSIYNVELGQTKETIEKKLGQAKRKSGNEYGTDWYTYHDNYSHFVMVMYDKNNQSAGLFTNQDLISSANGIKMGTSKQTVQTKLGAPLTKIQKGLTIYQLPEKRDYDVYLIGDEYVTIFYDKYNQNSVTAMQIIRKDIEQEKSDFYTKGSASMEDGFEYQLFDLTNADRVNHQLPILTWDQHIEETALKHSKDMAVHQYFDHTNLKGQSPFDRMKADHISFHYAGENIAYGQLSSIFAHEGLMNSLGHRENILQKNYKYLGVGVAFNTESQPYYTEDFYAK